LAVPFFQHAPPPPRCTSFNGSMPKKNATPSLERNRGPGFSFCAHLCSPRRIEGISATLLWRLWFPARPRGDPALVGGPPRQTPPRSISNRALGRAHSRPAVTRGDWISDGAGLFPSGFPSPPTSLVFLRNWWDLLVWGEFGAATSAVAGWVSERVLLGGEAALFVAV